MKILKKKLQNNSLYLTHLTSKIRLKIKTIKENKKRKNNL